MFLLSIYEHPIALSSVEEGQKTGNIASGLIVLFLQVPVLATQLLLACHFISFSLSSFKVY